MRTLLALSLAPFLSSACAAPGYFLGRRDAEAVHEAQARGELLVVRARRDDGDLVRVRSDRLREQDTRGDATTGNVRMRARFRAGIAGNVLLGIGGSLGVAAVGFGAATSGSHDGGERGLGATGAGSMAAIGASFLLVGTVLTAGSLHGAEVRADELAPRERILAAPGELEAAARSARRMAIGAGAASAVFLATTLAGAVVCGLRSAGALGPQGPDNLTAGVVPTTLGAAGFIASVIPMAIALHRLSALERERR